MAYYSNNPANFDTARSLTEDEMRRLAPSIFAVEAHESRSDRFKPIPTIEIIRGLQQEGFMPVAVKQSRARDEGKAEFTKHLIRLRRIEDDAKYQVGDNVCEINLKNANDGSSAYDLMAGLFRIRCRNSLVSQTATLDSVKVRHSGDALAKVIEGTYRVLGEAQNLLAAPQDWGKIVMGADAKMALAEAAHVLRFGDANGETHTAIKPTQLLTARREGDTGNDLWTVFNVTQEACLKGGLSARPAGYRDAAGIWHPARTTTSREVKGVDQDVKLNKALWVLGERMAQIMGQAKAA
jgi:hypothetical protein